MILNICFKLLVLNGNDEISFVLVYALTVQQRLGAADDSIMDFSRNYWEMDKTPSAIVPRLH